MSIPASDKPRYKSVPEFPEVVDILKDLGFEGIISYSLASGLDKPQDRRQADDAIKDLSRVLKSRDLTLSRKWERTIKLARIADMVGSEEDPDHPCIYNTLRTIGHAIEDAIRTREGMDPKPATDTFFNLDSLQQAEYEARKSLLIDIPFSHSADGLVDPGEIIALQEQAVLSDDEGFIATAVVLKSDRPIIAFARAADIAQLLPSEVQRRVPVSIDHGAKETEYSSAAFYLRTLG